jgi:hypothetical protein
LWKGGEQAERGSFIDMIFRLIMFHQSLHLLINWPDIVLLSLDEQFRYCDPWLYKLFAVLGNSDSASYFFFNEPQYVLDNKAESRWMNYLQLKKWRTTYPEVMEAKEQDELLLKLGFYSEQ